MHPNIFTTAERFYDTIRVMLLPAELTACHSFVINPIESVSPNGRGTVTFNTGTNTKYFFVQPTALLTRVKEFLFHKVSVAEEDRVAQQKAEAKSEVFSTEEILQMMAKVLLYESKDGAAEQKKNGSDGSGASEAYRV